VIVPAQADLGHAPDNVNDPKKTIENLNVTRDHEVDRNLEILKKQIMKLRTMEMQALLNVNVMARMVTHVRTLLKRT